MTPHQIFLNAKKPKFCIVRYYKDTRADQDEKNEIELFWRLTRELCTAALKKKNIVNYESGKLPNTNDSHSVYQIGEDCKCQMIAKTNKAPI